VNGRRAVDRVSKAEFIRRMVDIDQCVAKNKKLREANKRLNNRVYALVKENMRLKERIAEGYADYCELAAFVRHGAR